MENYSEYLMRLIREGVEKEIEICYDHKIEQLNRELQDRKAKAVANILITVTRQIEFSTMGDIVTFRIRKEDGKAGRA